jgi:hypothetical protein
MSDDSATRSVGRRRVLAVGAGAVATAAAGCSAIVGFISGLVLEEVNVFNMTDSQLRGSVEVTGPAGDSILDSEFDLAPEREEGGENSSGSNNSDGGSNASEDTVATYADVLTETGEYTVGVELAGDAEIEGESSATGTAELTDLETERIAVLLGASKTEEPITITVIETLSDLDQYVDESV